MPPEDEGRYALAARGANDGLWEWQIGSGEIVFSERWKSMLGFEGDELPNRLESWFDRVHPDDLPQLRADLQLHLDGQTPHFECEFRMLEQGGTWRWMLGRGVAARDDAGVAVRMGGSQTDITERKLAVEELLHHAFHDSLTGLPNRMLFMERLSGAAARLRREDAASIAILFIDLDRFKVINDSFGHHIGDALLIEVGRRIERCLRPGDTVARMSEQTVARLAGDEFTVLIENVKDMADALRVAERVAGSIREPYLLEGRRIDVTASIGVAVSAPGFDSPEDLLRGADAAMYRAKSLGEARFEVCDRNVHEQALERLRMERDLHGAGERGELRIAYQPIISVRNGEIAGFEALVRWQHPTRGLLMPDHFIGIAEEANLIHPISMWVLSQACAQHRHWQKKAGPDRRLLMAVNVSAKDLAYAEFPTALDAILEECGTDASLLRLEITETAMIRNIDAAVRTMEALRARNIRVIVDDFGTGYSSFAYLQQFPIDTLKIDRSFVSTMMEKSENGHLVQAMVGLASILGMNTVAEGVETDAQLAALRRFGCAYAQGFLFSQPLTASEAEALLESERNGRWACFRRGRKNE